MFSLFSTRRCETPSDDLPTFWAYHSPTYNKSRWSPHHMEIQQPSLYILFCGNFKGRRKPLLFIPRK